jgi:threonylcarbamoyladenosine tRNA methylthiotransferase MtaB
VASGYKEIVLTGVNVGDYGKRDGASLLSLLRELVRIDGLHRLRISSIEPNLLSSELLEFVASERVMCRHVHIPLQSGHDEILRAMRRRYTTGMYQRLIDRIKATIPECGIGVDIIVGFPGETQTHFDSTYHFLSALPVSYLHVFSYSERPNTPAASLPGQVRPEVRGERSKALRRLGLRKRRRFAEALFGRTVDVLLEGQVEGGRRYGLTDTYVRVGVPVEDTTENTILPVAITRAHDYGCFGEVVMNAPVAQ